ncbi:MAG: 2-oxo acid dehydrogenase subunit E2 [Nannocystaceae bacterium]|nr:2-oxo acid dehydrogenase subunit E2 [Myxococcales bacterium]
MRPSLLRDFLLWFFDHPPYSPFVTANIAVDVTGARRYLAALNDAAAGRPRVTLMHLFVALVARLYREFPQANARVIGGQIRALERVGVALPVDLLSDQSGSKNEVGLALVRDVDRRTLRALAEATRAAVADERRGEPRDPLLRLLVPLADRTPRWLLHGALTGLDRAAHSRLLSPLFHRLAPVSVAVTNPGAVFGPLEGARFLGASMSPPNRLCPVGSVIGLSAIQDEVVVIDGAPAVRPMLPVSYVFDHRLFDGVMCGRILLRLCEMLRDPAAVLGPDGEG